MVECNGWPWPYWASHRLSVGRALIGLGGESALDARSMGSRAWHAQRVVFRHPLRVEAPRQWVGIAESKDALARGREGVSAIRMAAGSDTPRRSCR